MFRTGRYLSESITVYTKEGSGPERWLINQRFSDRLADVHPMGMTWTWRFREFESAPGSATNKSFVARLDMTILPEFRERIRQDIIPCQFRFTIDPEYDFEDIQRITTIRATADSKTFILIAETDLGESFEILGNSTCYDISSCCSAGSCNRLSCCLPISPGIPVPSACLDGFLALDEANTEREWISRLEAEENEFISAYIKHCLEAAEELIMEYDDAQYHFTLFYYDQFNNLLKTVPPKGIRPLPSVRVDEVKRNRDAGTSLTPSHQLVTMMKYNTLDELVENSSPDAGEIRICYDELGRIIMTQSAVQIESNKFSYIVYDDIGRVIETGEGSPSSGIIPEKLDYSVYAGEWLTTAKSEIFKTNYDEQEFPSIEDHFEEAQKNLRNRISSITYQESEGIEYDHGIHYNYDILGNIREVVQDFTWLAREYPIVNSSGQHIKKVKYDYDLLSGKTNKVIYQPNQPDQFIHWYDYDGDYRLRNVRSGILDFKDLPIHDNEARYYYYKHGPLARLEIGHEKIQGLDYAYTINGWLKGLNSGTLDPDRDMGHDGISGGDLLHGLFAEDAYGFTLHYFENDYTPIGLSEIGLGNNFLVNDLGSSLNPDLWNGNIDYISNSNDGIPDHPSKANVYGYDQLNRLKNASTFIKDQESLNSSNSWTGGRIDDQFSSSYGYDPNGNITSLIRRDGRGTIFDQISFNIASTSNQLTHLTDAISTGVADNDLDSQSPNNYLYDASGRMISDNSAGISRINWRHDDKVKSIQYIEGEIEFMYDANGSRILKISNEGTKYYFRDHSGNILATYQISDDNLILSGLPVYGIDRLGITEVNQPVSDLELNNPISKMRGIKIYEISGNTNNVERLVSDRKVPLSSVEGVFVADGIAAMEFFPFGMLKTTEELDTTNYLYGFQGQEKDNEHKGEGNSYYTEFRMYDPRTGRWLSRDKVTKHHESPYLAYGNNPKNNIDPSGLDEIFLPAEEFQEYEDLLTLQYAETRTGNRPLFVSDASDEDRINAQRWMADQGYRRIDEQSQDQLSAQQRSDRNNRGNSEMESASSSNRTHVGIFNSDAADNIGYGIEGGEWVVQNLEGNSARETVRNGVNGLRDAHEERIRQRYESRAVRAEQQGSRARTPRRIREQGQRRVNQYRARNPRIAPGSPTGTGRIISGAGKALSFAGFVLNAGGMMERQYELANDLVGGDMGGLEYTGKSIWNITSGIAGCLPFGDSVILLIYDPTE
jgi:RHS repeat-associated protein